MHNSFDKARELVNTSSTITVLTGAGMSAESGVPTFRDAQIGLWAHYNPEELASLAAWKKDKSLVWAWYISRFAFLDTVQPHAGHYSLAELAKHKSIAIVTQNIDNLHERAGSSHVYHLHGTASNFLCDTCGTEKDTQSSQIIAAKEYIRTHPDTLRLDPPQCECHKGTIRPAIVWFGENLPIQPWNAALNHITHSDLLIVIGTSGIVYPAAGLPAIAYANNIPIIEYNTTTTPITDLATIYINGPCAKNFPDVITGVK